jgi:hypothetical protein
MGSGCIAACSGLAASAPMQIHRTRRAKDTSRKNFDRTLMLRLVGMVDMEPSVWLRWLM